jgi:transposase-like protein
MIVSNVNCPHCEESLDTSDWFEYGGHDGDCFDIQCSKCDQHFDVTTSVTVSYIVLEDEVLDDE